MFPIQTAFQFSESLNSNHQGSQDFFKKIINLLPFSNCLRQPATSVDLQDIEDYQHLVYIAPRFKAIANKLGEDAARKWQDHLLRGKYFSIDDAFELIHQLGVRYTCENFGDFFPNLKPWLKASKAGPEHQTHETTHLLIQQLGRRIQYSDANFYGALYCALLGLQPKEFVRSFGDNAFHYIKKMPLNFTAKAALANSICQEIEKHYTLAGSDEEYIEDLFFKISPWNQRAKIIECVGSQHEQSIIDFPDHKINQLYDFIDRQSRTFAEFEQQIDSCDQLSLQEILYCIQFKVPQYLKNAFANIQLNPLSSNENSEGVAPQTINDLLENLLHIYLNRPAKDHLFCQSLIQCLKKRFTKHNPFGIRSTEALVIPKLLKNCQNKAFEKISPGFDSLNQFQKIRAVNQIMQQQKNLIINAWFTADEMHSLKKQLLNNKLTNVIQQMEFVTLERYFGTTNPKKLLSFNLMNGVHLMLIGDHANGFKQLEHLNTLWSNRADKLKTIRLQTANNPQEALIHLFSDFLNLTTTVLKRKINYIHYNQTDDSRIDVSNLSIKPIIFALQNIEPIWAAFDDIFSTYSQSEQLEALLGDPDLSQFGELLLDEPQHDQSTDGQTRLMELCFKDLPKLSNSFQQLLKGIESCQNPYKRITNLFLNTYKNLVTYFPYHRKQLINLTDEYNYHIKPYKDLLLQLIQLTSLDKSVYLQDIHNQMIQHFNQLKNELPASTLAIIEGLTQAAQQESTTSGIESDKSVIELLRAYENIQQKISMTPNTINHDFIHKSVTDFYKHFLQSTPHNTKLINILEEKVYQQAIQLGIHNPKQKAEQEIPELESILECERHLDHIKQTQDQNLHQKWFENYITADTLLKHHSTPSWIQKLIEEHVNDIRENFIIKPQNMNLNVWRNQLSLISKAGVDIGLSPMVLARDSIQKHGGVNNHYLYTDEEIEQLLNKFHGTLNAKAAENIQISPSTSDINTLKHLIDNWLGKTSENQAGLLVLPYSPLNADGDASNHWTGLVLSKTVNNTIQVAYNDPLQKISDVPPALQQTLRNLVESANQKHQTNYQLTTKDFLALIHPQQSDFTSCGPYVVAGLEEMIRYWVRTQGTLPLRITADKNSITLRQQHLQRLGGLNSTFGNQQLWNIQTVGGIELEDLRLQETLLKQLIQLFKRLPKTKVKAFSEQMNYKTIVEVLPQALGWKLKAKTGGLTPEEMIEKALKQTLVLQHIDHSIQLLANLPKPQTLPIFKTLKSFQSDNYDPGALVNELKTSFAKLIKPSEGQNAVYIHKALDQEQAIKILTPFFAELVMGEDSTVDLEQSTVMDLDILESALRS